MRRLAALAASLFPWFALARAALADQDRLTALLDGTGKLRLARGGLAAPSGAVLPGDLPDPVQRRVRAALASGSGIQASTAWAGKPVQLRLTPGPLRRGGVLHLRDRSPEAALEEALEQAQRLQSVGELAGGIAHDFNNLLTAIFGAAEELLAAPAGAAWNAELQQIQASARRGAELVRQLLAFSQRQTLQPRPLVLDEAVERAAGLLRRLLGKSVILDLRLEAPGRLVLMDPTQLDQVLVNLAVNARNAMPVSGGRITISTGFRLVLASDRPSPGQAGDFPPPGRYVVLDITDTGCGIAANILPRIFDPFFTTRRNEGGTGLGLAMVLGIIRQSGGYLSVRSACGEGTAFSIVLPRWEGALPQAAPVPPPRQAATGQAARPAILLVDDDAAVRLLARRALVRAGWNVIEAADGEDGLEHRGAAIGCIVSDVSMPGLDGPGLVRALRAEHPGLPAILMSGYADEAQRRALASEDIIFLPKPFAPSELADMVGAAMAKTAASVT